MITLWILCEIWFITSVLGHYNFKKKERINAFDVIDIFQYGFVVGIIVNIAVIIFFCFKYMP